MPNRDWKCHAAFAEWEHLWLFCNVESAFKSELQWLACWLYQRCRLHLITCLLLFQPYLEIIGYCYQKLEAFMTSVLLIYALSQFCWFFYAPSALPDFICLCWNSIFKTFFNASVPQNLPSTTENELSITAKYLSSFGFWTPKSFACKIRPVLSRTSAQLFLVIKFPEILETIRILWDVAKYETPKVLWWGREM